MREQMRRQWRRPDLLSFLTDDEWAAHQPSGAVAGFAIVGLCAFVIGLVLGFLMGRGL